MSRWQVLDLGPVVLDQKILPIAPASMLCNQPSYDPRQNALVVGFQHGAFVRGTATTGPS